MINIPQLLSVLTALLLSVSVSAAFSSDSVVIYRHVEPDGTINLTNRPNGDGRYVPFARFNARKIVARVGLKGVQTLSQHYGQIYGLDPRLIEAVILTESGYNPKAVSPKGAAGLMQLMPETGKALGVKDRFDPDENVSGGVRYLKAMIDKFGSIELGLAAYNAGPGAVTKYGGIPPYKETQDYVRRIMARWSAQ